MMNEENLSGSEDVLTGDEAGLNEGAGENSALIDEHADTSRDWISRLPDGVKEAKAWNKFTQGEDTKMVEVPESLLKSHLSLEGMLSSQRKVPDTPEEQDAFYQELGWKSEFEDYSKGIERKEVPEGITYDTEFEDYMLQMAHEARVPQAKAQELYNKIFDSRVQDIQAGNEDAAAYKAKIEDDFKREFGGDLDTMKTRARVAIEEYESPEFIDILNNAEYQGVKVGDHPAMFKFFSKLGKEKLGIGNERGKGQSMDDTSSIQEQINSAMADPAYMDDNHINHKMIVNKVQNLYRRLHGEI